MPIEQERRIDESVISGDNINEGVISARDWITTSTTYETYTLLDVIEEMQRRWAELSDRLSEVEDVIASKEKSKNEENKILDDFLNEFAQREGDSNR